MEKIRIQDDLFNYVNGEWIEKAVIPSDKPRCGGFSDLDSEVESLLIADFNKMIKEDKYPNEYLRKACEFYSLVKNCKKRKSAGAKPTFKTLAKIEKLTSIRQLNRKAKEFVEEGLPLPFELSVEIDMKDTSKRLVLIQGPSTILPDVTYYGEPMKAQKDALIGMWSNMVKGVLAYTKLTPEEGEQYLKDALEFDAKLATLVKSSQEWSEYTKIYNPTPIKKVASMLKPFKFKKLLENLYNGEVPEIICVAEPRYFKAFKTVFNDETFVLYKHWAFIRELLGSTGLLSEELRDLGSTYSRALNGIAEISPIEKYAYKLTCSFFSEPIGLYYGEKYFGEEAKKDVISMVKEIIEMYKTRVKNNDFLAQSTKDKAILKLSTMAVKMGYPDKVDSFYDLLDFTGAKNLYEAAQKLSKIRRIYNIQLLNKPVDRGLWPMPGNMVNACYNPFSNDITFPAAILQAPFYSIKQSRSTNLGGIGAVIGHEISHAFDNNGASFDENGNLADWWTKEDFKNFKKKTKEMIKEFEGIKLPWGEVNSELIVSENIADNGGMAVTLNIMKNTPEANYEEYFVNWAKVWCEKAKPEFQALLLRVDVHAPAILRANMQPRNFEEWYNTFKVKKTDQMFISPSKRVIIW